MNILAYVVSVAAILMMTVNLVLIILLLIRYKGKGKVVNRLRLLLLLITFFLSGYIASPFLVAMGLPDVWLVILVFSVFFFGALYVTITLAVLSKVFSLLKLLKDKS